MSDHPVFTMDGPPPRVLVVDDEVVILRALERLLGRAGAHVVTMESGLEAVAAIGEEEIEIALLDIKMPHIGGLDLLRSIKEAHPDVEVVMMTAHATIETAVQAVKAGAYDYLTKPFPDVSEVVQVVQRAVERRRLQQQNRRLQAALDAKESFEGIVGGSAAMKEVFELVESVAYSSSTVMVTGESGTGKELVARAIHYRSPRRDGPFIPINCTAMPETLLESELFGHVKGAFTGATVTKKGLFEAADGGTLFLDEVGDLPASIQAKLLRVLQEGEVRKVGGNETVKVDVRVIAATHVDLDAARREGRFREDLYYRLNVIEIHLPPLAERLEDIPVLAHHFLKKFCEKEGKAIEGFTTGAMEVLTGYRWPGNVRELENVVQRAVVLCRGEAVDVEDLPKELTRQAEEGPSPESAALSRLPFSKAKELATEAFEKRYLEAVLRRAGGNISEASRLAGMDRSNFRRVMKRYQLDPQRFAAA